MKSLHLSDEEKRQILYNLLSTYWQLFSRTFHYKILLVQNYSAFKKNEKGTKID